VKKREPI